MRRSNLLVLLGLASFLLGLLAVYFITQDDGEVDVASPDTVEVLVAAETLDSGSLGEDLIANGRVRTERVAVAERAAGALTAPSQLSGARLTSTFAEGEQITQAGVQAFGGSRAQIPDGFEAVALDIGFVAGGANSIIPGDRVNVYLNAAQSVAAVAGGGDGVLVPSPTVELLLTNVLVLDVNRGDSPLTVSQSSTAGQNPPTDTGGSLIVVVAVDTTDAEKVIFGSATAGNSLYLTRVPLDDQGNPPPPAGDTGGRTGQNVLDEDPRAAFERSNG